MDDLDLVSGDPDVNMLEAVLPGFLPGVEESVSGWVICIDAHSEKVVAVARADVLPGAGYANRVLGNPAEAITQLLGRPVELFRFDEAAVVLVQR